MKTKQLFLLLPVLLMLPSLQTLADPPVTFEVVTSFSYPNSISTVANTIDDRDRIGGWCELDPLTVRGFIRFRDGQVSAPITAPDSSNGTTYVTGLNNTGIVSGYYETAAGDDGFLYSDATFTTIHLDPSYTYVEKINDAGDYCGNTLSGAFVSIGGTVTTFSVPGAPTGANGINNLDQVVGYYSVGDATSSYRRNADGTLDYPIAVPGVSFTGLRDINDQGWMVGVASSATAGTHAVLFVRPDAFVLYDYPGAGTTYFTGINSHGLICGNYTDASGHSHAFIVRARSTTAAR